MIALSDHRIRASLTVACAMIIQDAIAEPLAWNACVVEKPAILQPMPAAPDGEMKVYADELSSSGQNNILFEGGVEVIYDGQTLRADHARVWNDPRKVEAEGHIELTKPAEGLVIRGEAATLTQAEQRGEFRDIRYEYGLKQLYGKAAEVTQQGNVLRLKDASYSSCLPEKPDWLIKATTIRLDQDRGMGSAVNAVFQFKQIPLLYLPYITFPFGDDRRTGFLIPIVGRSDAGGAEFRLPFYWNIAPQVDMTLTPRWMEQRGTMIEDELRYLGRKYQGKLTGYYLGDDKVVGGERYHYMVDHYSRLSRRWSLSLEGQTVSDGDYFVDFSSGLNESSQTHLERHADLRYHDRYWSGLIRSQVYQTIDDTIAADERPYRRLPQMTLLGQLPLNQRGLSLQFDFDYTRFSHDELIEGDRLDFAPSLAYSLIEPGYFIKPKASWHQTWYELKAHQTNAARSEVRGLPVATVDSGLIFERVSPEGGGITSLEPRLFYLYVPYRNQADLPVFDSNEPAFIFSSLFRDNRFNGRDRVGDANQLTTALTGRYFSGDNGRELFSASIGQIHYFSDRNVVLPNTETETSHRSDYAAEVAVVPDGQWSGRASLIAASNLESTRVATLSLSYRGHQNRIANIEQRFRDGEDINQTDVSAAWPINKRWRVLGRWLYSQTRSRDLDMLFGLEYESCCWRARLTARRYILDEQEDYNKSYFLQIDLKGLGSFGEGQSLLERSIPGYRLDEE